VQRPRRTLVVLALLVVIGAGCSAAPADTTSGDTARAQGVSFAACMRTNGITAFPDPDASGSLTIDGIANGSAVDPSTAAFTQALDACKDLQPAGFMGPGEVSPEQQDARLEFARCMRDHGVADFPDPTPDSPLVDTNRIPSAARNGGMTILNAAMKACGELVADALGDR
jgi:hypothetical protein